MLESGERVYLRAPAARDHEEILERVRASRSLHRSLVSPPKDERSFRDWLARTRTANAAGFLACRHEDDAIVGVFTLGQIVRGPLQSAYLGFYGFSPFEGQGYMTEAMRLLLRHAFGAMKLHRVEANIQPGNAASIVLVRRCGFRLEASRRGTSRSPAGGATTSDGRSSRRNALGDGPAGWPGALRDRLSLRPPGRVRYGTTSSTRRSPWSARTSSSRPKSARPRT